MEFTKTENGFVSSFRGHGVAGNLLNTLVEDMKHQNKKIKASCSYIVKKFSEDSSYDFINADK